MSSALAKVKWQTLAKDLRLQPSVAQSLNELRARAGAAASRKNELLAQIENTQIDFDEFRAKINKAGIVDNVEKQYKSRKLPEIDFKKQIAILDQFEKQALESAKDTVQAVEKELVKLSEALHDIEIARPIEDLTVQDVSDAAPELETRFRKQMEEGKYHVPGYREKFGDLTIM